MPVEFKGPATPMTSAAIEAAAAKIGCQVAAVRAVIDVESRGGFQADKRPKILFERHYFHRLTRGKWSGSHPDISNPSFGGYGLSAAQYDRLYRAIALDRDAALRSASWGAFQIMGDNCKLAGFADVESFVASMVEGEDRHLEAFVAFVKANRLDDEMRRLDWAGFARRYNGPAYLQNRYDTKLSAAFALHSAGGPKVDSPQPLLRMGDRGDAVSRLQVLLDITVDGDFGGKTKDAVVKFQRKVGLYPDGVVGGQTWAALEAAKASKTRPELKRGSKGPDVMTLQGLLGLAADGGFGPITEQAVRDFQARAKLPQTGVVNDATWEKLYASQG